MKVNKKNFLILNIRGAFLAFDNSKAFFKYALQHFNFEEGGLDFKVFETSEKFHVIDGCDQYGNRWERREGFKVDKIGGVAK